MKKNFSKKSQAKLRPAEEVARLGYFVGKWKTKGKILAGPWGEGGKFSWKETTKWMAGKFFVVGRWDFKMPAALGGDGEEIFIMGYDLRRKVYTFDAFSSQGLHQVSTGTFAKDLWIWTSEATIDGRATRQKMTMKILSAKRYTLKFELSEDGTKWATFMEGKATKVK